jgi:hypothetical protein
MRVVAGVSRGRSAAGGGRFGRTKPLLGSGVLAVVLVVVGFAAGECCARAYGTAAGKRGAGGRAGGGGIRGGGVLHAGVRNRGWRLASGVRAVVRVVAGFAAGECCTRALRGGRRACGRPGVRSRQACGSSGDRRAGFVERELWRAGGAAGVSRRQGQSTIRP